jgi:predicted transcriptional regulator
MRGIKVQVTKEQKLFIQENSGKMTQVEIAEHLGLNKKYISYYLKKEKEQPQLEGMFDVKEMGKLYKY